MAAAGPRRRARARILDPRRRRGQRKARLRRRHPRALPRRHHPRAARSRSRRAHGRARGDPLPATPTRSDAVTTANEYDPVAAAAAERTTAQRMGIALSRSWLFIFLLLMIGF